MHTEFTFFGGLTLYSWPLWGNGTNVKLSTTCPEESPTLLWSFNSSSWKLCDARWIYVFGGLTLYLWPLWGTVQTSSFPRPVPKSHRRSCEASTLHLENCAMHVEFTFFEWLTLSFWLLWVNGRNVNPSTTCPEESPTFLRSFNSSSWKLCECTSNSRFLED